jgi:hypothetical protein
MMITEQANGKQLDTEHHQQGTEDEQRTVREGHTKQSVQPR